MKQALTSDPYMKPETSVKSDNLINQFRDIYPALYFLSLRFGDCRIMVGANEDIIIRELADYFNPFLENNPQDTDIFITAHEAPSQSFPFSFTIKTPDPGKTKIKEEYADFPDYRVVRKRLTGMAFVFGRGDHVAVGPCIENLNQVVNFINNRYIEWKLCHGCLLGHAAGIIWNGRGLAMAGFSGAGKSTLALHLMNHGAIFISNDRLMIERNSHQLSMYGVAKLPRINPGTVLNNPNLIDIMPVEDQKRFSALPREELWHLKHKYDASIDTCFGTGRFVLDASMHGLVILNWKPDENDTTVREVSLSERRDLLPAFMKSTGLFFLPSDNCQMPEPCEENYIEFLSACNVWEVSGGIDFQKVAEVCMAYLE